jgi:AcrR family transcriptional regulator
MARRKDPDYENRRQQIIDGALKAFAAQGFEKTTNREIAESAGIGSPGLIYHYFRDKEDLFQQVFEQRHPLLLLLNRPEEIFALPPAEALTRIGRAYLKIIEQREAVALFKLLIGEAARRPEAARAFLQFGPNRVLGFVASYLESQMQAGTLRHVDASQAARSFLGPMALFLLAREIFQQPEAMQTDPETVVAGTVDLFLRGMYLESEGGEGKGEGRS